MLRTLGGAGFALKLLVSSLALSSHVAAQSDVMGSALGNVSPQCARVLKDAWMGDLGSCINIVGLFSMITADQDKSVLPQLKDYLAGLAKEDPCQPDLLAALSKNLDANCSPEDKKQQSVMLVKTIIKNYPGLYQMLTLRPSNATTGATFCMTRMLMQGEAISNQPFTAPFLMNTFNGNLGPLVKILSKDPRIYCGNACGRTVLNTALLMATNNSATASQVGAMRDEINGKCGDDYVKPDGNVPNELNVGTGSGDHIMPTYAGALSTSLLLLLSALSVVYS